MLDKFLHPIRKLAMKGWLYPKYRDYPIDDCYNLLLPIFSKKDSKLEGILDIICTLAAKKGFVFVKPKIRVIRKGLRQRITHWHDGEVISISHVCGLALDGDLILIFWKVIDEFTEMELAVVVAHEFGHILDYQTDRKGHPLFDNIRHADGELFADAIAAYLYTKLVVKTAYERRGIKMNDLAFLSLNLNV